MGYFDQLEKNYAFCKKPTRFVLEMIRKELMQHPMDIKGNKMSYLAAKMFLKKQNLQNNQPESKIQNIIRKMSPFCSKVQRIFIFSVQVIIWVYVLITDILVIHNFKNISISIPFNNITRRSQCCC